MAATSCVPSVKWVFQKYCWTPELNELKQQCIDATDLWESVGSGNINNNRAWYKLKYNTVKEAELMLTVYLVTTCTKSCAIKAILLSGKPGVNVFVHVI